MSHDSDDDVHSFEDIENDDESGYDEEKGLGRYGSDDDSDNKVSELEEIEKKVNAAIRLRREEKEQKIAAEGVECGGLDEGLGDNFDETPWVAPTLEVAWEWRLKNLYRGGKSAISGIKLTRSNDIGKNIFIAEDICE